MKPIQPSSGTSCADVIQSLFNFTNLDILVYKTLQEQGEMRTQQLAHLLDRERSTVYRSLQRLTDCGLCEKHTKTIKSGGYYYTYVCKDPDQVKNQLASCIESWYTSMQQVLARFDVEFGQKKP